MAAVTNQTTQAGQDEVTELAKQYDTPMGLAHSTMQALKDRIKLHYDLASDYYLNLWCVFKLFLGKFPTGGLVVQSETPLTKHLKQHSRHNSYRELTTSQGRAYPSRLLGHR